MSASEEPHKKPILPGGPEAPDDGLDQSTLRCAEGLSVLLDRLRRAVAGGHLDELASLADELQAMPGAGRSALLSRQAAALQQAARRGTQQDINAIISELSTLVDGVITGQEPD